MRHRDAADVVVVGAGIAGLVAACRIAEAGLSPLVLEAHPTRVGGRLEAAVRNGHTLDLGGTWIGSGHVRAAALARELGIGTWLSWDHGERVFSGPSRVGGLAHRAVDRLTAIDQRMAEIRLARLSRHICHHTPWHSPLSRVLDRTTLDAWLSRAALTARSRAGLRLLLTNVLAVDLRQVSLLHALYYLRSNGGLGRLLRTTGGAQERLLTGGAHLMAERLAERLGDAVRLGSRVRRIEQDGGGVVVESDSGRVRAGAAVVALPPTLSAGLDIEPRVPARDRLAECTRQGDVVRMVALYDEPFWRERGLSGEAWGPGMPFSLTHDVSAPGGPGVLSVFALGPQARRLRQVPAEARRAAVLGALARCFGPEAGHAAAYVERDWVGDAWTRGGYGGAVGPGGWTRHGHALREPAGRVCWAGTETAREHTGYVEGAIESGERAAGEALALAG